MDKKNLQVGGLVAAIVIALGLVITMFVKNMNDGQGARTADQSEVLNAIDRVGGDPNKLDPVMKAKFDEMNRNNPFSSTNHYSQKPSTGTPAGYPAPPTGSSMGGGSMSSAPGGSGSMGGGSGGYPAPPR